MLPIKVKSVELPMPPGSESHLSRICLRVRDPERSAEFYQTVLGLKLKDRQPRGGGATCALRSPDGRLGF